MWYATLFRQIHMQISNTSQTKDNSYAQHIKDLCANKPQCITPLRPCSIPFSGNVIFVPFFQPGLISILRISDIRSGLPAALCTVLLTFIFFLPPRYSSCSVQGSVCSIAGGCRCCCCCCMPARNFCLCNSDVNSFSRMTPQTRQNASSKKLTGLIYRVTA